MTIKAGTKIYDKDGVSGFEFVKDYPVGTIFTADHVRSFGDVDDPVTGMNIPWWLGYYIATRKSPWSEN